MLACCDKPELAASNAGFSVKGNMAPQHGTTDWKHEPLDF